ncbi:MAG: invasion associated locus B family protein [Cellvibrionaceae bacterium]|nr:invasion associated locus B family protein [Cellvibrionaceae bacterium]MCV6626631.1 invasion associated locus B family protein [Cellvibrionaceae bacterium]
MIKLSALMALLLCASLAVGQAGFNKPIVAAQAKAATADNTGEPAAENKAVYQDWLINCAQGNCIVHQYILDEQEHVVSSVSIHQKEQQLLITFTVPLMTRIDKGVVVKIIRYDEKEIFQQRYHYSYCTQIGCMLTYPLSQSLMQAMQAGRKMQLNFASLDGHEHSATHSMFGFTKALQAYRELPQE